MYTPTASEVEALNTLVDDMGKGTAAMYPGFKAAEFESRVQQAAGNYVPNKDVPFIKYMTKVMQNERNMMVRQVTATHRLSL